MLAGLAGSIPGILPELIIAGFFLLMLVAEISFGKRRPLVMPVLATAGVLASAIWLLADWPDPEVSGSFLGMVRPDGFSGIFRLLFAAALLMTIWISHNSSNLRENSHGLGEYYLVIMAMLLGLNFMSMATNLLMMYLALELVSLPSYVLTAYTRLSRGSAEASLKYILYGAFSSGIMLYGISWLYGLTGTLDPFSPAFAKGLAAAGPLAGTFVITLVLAGFAFKVSALPFHFWTPDVYEGAPYPVAAFFAVAPKAAGFAMLIRFLQALEPGPESLKFNISAALAVMALGSMTLGNLAAMRQVNIRRMLAWSSIAHAGYLLLGVLLMSTSGTVSVVFYLIAYFFMTYGAFAAAGWVRKHFGTEKIEDYKGLGKHIPLLATVMVIFMISLTGIPPTAGFIGKLEIFLGMLESYQQSGGSWLILLMAAAVINTVISIFYYLRVPVLMIFHNSSIKFVPQFRGLIPVLLLILALPVVWLGIFHFDALINFIRAQIMP